MPGIFAFMLPAPDQRAAATADKIMHDMCLFPWQGGIVSELRADQFFLGVVANNKKTDVSSRHYHRHDHLTCVVDGHIVRARDSCGVDSILSQQRYAEAAILAYRKYGLSFAARLEGQYSCILYDSMTGHAIVADDRYGLAPLYYWHGDHTWAYCSMLGPIAASGLFTPAIDPEALASLFSYRQLYGRLSIVRDVRLYDPATIVDHDLESGRADAQRYWHYGHMGEKNKAPSCKRRLSDICDAFVAASHRITRGPGQYTMALSGGMDSRLVVGLAVARVPDLIAWTFGTPEAPDLRVARQISGILGVEHRFFPVNLAQIERHSYDFATTVNGCSSLIGAYALARDHALRDVADVQLNGYRGGLILGDTVVDIGLPHALAYWRYRLGRGERCSPPTLDNLRTDEELALFYRDVGPPYSALGASFIKGHRYDLEQRVYGMMKSLLQDVPGEYKLEEFTEEYGGGRHYTLLGILHDRHFCGDASPFYDYDVRELCQSLPPRWKRHRRAYIAVLKRLVPVLAKCEYVNTGQPAAAPPALVIMKKVMRRIRKQRTAVSTGVNSHAWLRNPAVADYFRDRVLDKRFLSRPWWDGPLIANCFDEHLQGIRNCADEIGLAGSVELFARQWLDR